MHEYMIMVFNMFGSYRGLVFVLCATCMAVFVYLLAKPGTQISLLWGLCSFSKSETPVSKPLRYAGFIGIFVMLTLVAVVSLRHAGTQPLPGELAQLQAKYTELENKYKKQLTANTLVEPRYNEPQPQNTELKKQYDALLSRNNDLQSRYDALKKEYADYVALHPERHASIPAPVNTTPVLVEVVYTGPYEETALLLCSRLSASGCRAQTTKFDDWKRDVRARLGKDKAPAVPHCGLYYRDVEADKVPGVQSAITSVPMHVQISAVSKDADTLKKIGVWENKMLIMLR